MTKHPLERWLEERKRAGDPVRKRQLAETVGCSPSRMTQILKWDEPSLGLAAKLNKATGIPVEQFAKPERVG